MALFEIDPDIRKARTLSSDFYTSQNHFEASKEKVFGRTWHVACDLGDVDNLLPVTLLRNFLDEPLLISRRDDRVRCVSNVCTHRGMILVGDACRGDLIRCGYHGRRFSLDGKFLSMPEFDGVENFPSAADDLRSFQICDWNSLLFISLDPISSFDSFLAGSEKCAPLTDVAAISLASSRDYEVAAHWALYCENYLEGFHIPFVHDSLNAVVDYGTYTTETFRFSSLQIGFDSGGDIAAAYFFMFPNTMFNFYPWGVSVNVVRPVSARSTVVSFLTYVSDETKLGAGAGADLHRVELEDERVVASVQKGVSSRFYDRGRYSPSREQGTHHFHRLIAEFME